MLELGTTRPLQKSTHIGSSSEDAEDAARKFADSIASVYRLSKHKIALLKPNEVLPELDRLLQLKHRLRKLWQETSDPACETAVNWVTKQYAG
jgi:hypothetical protein